MMDLTAKNVREIFAQCLPSEPVEGTPKRPVLRVEGVFNEVTFDRGRLEAHTPDIRDFFSRVSTFFYEDRGGGHSCRLLGFRRDGTRWGALTDIESLLALGLGLGIVTYCLDRSRWDLFPDGQPYVRLDGDVFRLWATFRRQDLSSANVMLSFSDDRHPPPVGFRHEDWFRPATFKVSDLKSKPTHVADAFYQSVIVDGFFDGGLPSWVLDPETVLHVY